MVGPSTGITPPVPFLINGLPPAASPAGGEAASLGRSADARPSYGPHHQLQAAAPSMQRNPHPNKQKPHRVTFSQSTGQVSWNPNLAGEQLALDQAVFQAISVSEVTVIAQPWLEVSLHGHESAPFWLLPSQL